MMTLENSKFCFKICIYSETFFHDLLDNHMQYQCLTKHSGDAQNKKQKYITSLSKKSPMYHVMILLIFHFVLGSMKNLTM